MTDELVTNLCDETGDATRRFQGDNVIAMAGTRHNLLNWYLLNLRRLSLSGGAWFTIAVIALFAGIPNAMAFTPSSVQETPPGALARLVQAPRLKPAAPGPRFATRGDLEELRTIKDFVERRAWSSARDRISRVKDADARSLAQWYYYEARDPNVDIVGGIAYLNTHEGWPSASKIQRHLEEELTDRTPADIAYNLFENRNPLTGNGFLQLIRVLLDRGDTEAARIYIRDSWQTHGFTASQERFVRNTYGSYLTAQDHIARVDNKLWARQVSSAQRSFSLLPSEERRKAEARAALYLRAGNAQSLFLNLPEDSRQDAGVQHAAIRYYRRGDNEDRAIELVRQLPDDPAYLRNPSRFWDERNLLMRWALKNGRFHDAYAMTSNHGLNEGLDFAEAEFNAGWIAMRFLADPARAEGHFLLLADWATSPISSARAYYWLGRAAKAMGKDALARERFAVAANYIYTYYGQLAAEELGGVHVAQKFVTTAVVTEADRASFVQRPSAKAFRILTDLDERRGLLIFSYNLDDQLETAGEYLLLAELTSAEQAPHLTIRAGKTAVRKQKFIPEVSYPLITVPDDAGRFVPAELILGLSRQESEFNPRAYSRAGARGVMQLLPTTAQLTARKERLPYSKGALLTDPAYNMTIGSAHLSHLIDRFDRSLILTFVGYNAGPHRADQWIQTYGDPRSASVDPVDWVELIPFSETRNYVQRVLENMQIYRARLNGVPIAGQLAADLENGGASNRAARLARPSARLDAVRTATDRRKNLPRLSERATAQIKQAQLSVPVARGKADHLRADTLQPAIIPAAEEKRKRRSRPTVPASGQRSTDGNLSDPPREGTQSPGLAPATGPATVTTPSATGADGEADDGNVDQPSTDDRPGQAASARSGPSRAEQTKALPSDLPGTQAPTATWLPPSPSRKNTPGNADGDEKETVSPVTAPPPSLAPLRVLSPSSPDTDPGTLLNAPAPRSPQGNNTRAPAAVDAAVNATVDADPTGVSSGGTGDTPYARSLPEPAASETVTRATAQDAISLDPKSRGEGAAALNPDGCASYRTFVADTLNNDAETGAADLNAAMMAEFRGGSRCTADDTDPSRQDDPGDNPE